MLGAPGRETQRYIRNSVDFITNMGGANTEQLKWNCVRSHFHLG